MQRGVDENSNQLFELDTIIAASDILALYKGIDEITLARIIDNAICLSTKFDSVEKKYRRYPSNDFGLPIPYYFVGEKDGKYACKKIQLPAPYSTSSHDSFELNIDFSGIVFEEKEIKAFLEGDYFKKYHENDIFYSAILQKSTAISSNKKESNDIFVTELLQELRMLRFLNEQMKHFYMDQYSDFWDNRAAQFKNLDLRQEIENFKNNPKALKEIWGQSVMHAVEYAYVLGCRGEKALSKDNTLEELRKKGMSSWVFEAFWRGLPEEAKQHSANTPKKFKN